MLDAAANGAGWNSKPPRGAARGIAIGAAFNTIVAQAVEVSGSARKWRMTRSCVAIDSYITVNPGQVEAQIVGGVVHGLNAALYGRQTFSNGAAQVKNFNKSRMIRIGEMPTVKVLIMPSPAVMDRTASIGPSHVFVMSALTLHTRRQPTQSCHCFPVRLL